MTGTGHNGHPTTSRLSSAFGHKQTVTHPELKSIRKAGSVRNLLDNLLQLLVIAAIELESRTNRYLPESGRS